MAETYAASPERLPRPPYYRLLQSALGDLVLRPWFDWVALNSVARGYFPLSRAWAAAAAVEGAPGPFRKAFPDVELPRAITRPALMLVAARQAAYRLAAGRWEDAFFAPTAPAGEALVEAELERQEASHQFMVTRFAFLPLRRRLPAVRWQVASPDEVAAKHARRLADPEAAYRAPPRPEITASHPVLSAFGQEYWLRYPAPVMGDTAWARVVEPEGAREVPTLIFLHGIAMETDMWRGSSDLVSELALDGIRVIKPEGPWHARRRLEGWYGGEPAIGYGPMGFLDLFHAWIAEVAALIAWARERGGGPIAVGGVSLGALTAQRAAVAARAWPPSGRPDVLFLVATSGAMMEVTHAGSLAGAVDLSPQIEAAGWTVGELTRWLPLVEPRDPPAMTADRVVMVLGQSDDVTPSAGGLALARLWRVPQENVFARAQGHFSVSLGILRDRAPLERLKEVLRSAG